MQGRIFQLNTSGGGVPKLAVREAMLTSTGLADDVQTHMNIHGGPERALCLYSLERILELQDEGHPIFPGAVGENVTLMGLDWASIAPGVRLSLGRCGFFRRLRAGFAFFFVNFHLQKACGAGDSIKPGVNVVSTTCDSGWDFI